VLVDLKKPDAALEHLRISLQLRPNHPESLMAAGLAFFSKGLNAEAINLYQRAIQVKPDFTEAYCNLGVALERSTELTNRRPRSEQALRLNLNLPEAHLNIATALRDKGSIDEAIARYRTAIALKPTPANLGTLLYTLHFHRAYTPERIRAEHEAYDAAVRVTPGARAARE